MIALPHRVSSASVTVGDTLVAHINRGLLAHVGFENFGGNLLPQLTPSANTARRRQFMGRLNACIN